MNLPPGVADIPLMYLMYPELLKLEREDPEINNILANPKFWRNRLRDEYNLLPEALEKIKDPRSEYHRLFIRTTVEQDSYFPIGFLCLPLKHEDYSLILRNQDDIYAYVAGTYLGGCKELSEAFEGDYSPEKLQEILALHRGDKKMLQEIFHTSILKNLYPYSRYPNYLMYYTPEAIDHAIEFGLERPQSIFDRYREIIDTPSMGNSILEHFLNRYGDSIPLGDLQRKTERLGKYLKENISKEKRFLELSRLSDEELKIRGLLPTANLLNLAQDFSIRIKRDQIAREMIFKYLTERDEKRSKEIWRKILESSA